MGITDGLGGLADKAKGLMSDEQVDQVAEQIKDKAPDQVDGGVDALAEQAKKIND
ncbi:hypothetical protein CLV28_1635 [Sediminihabitans luteus]|uniref:Antitoxin protein of toxin-antitoxin system n=1 Tax=Sediminihabitans luteus TaxID=1138585 RepID=A0A2M9CQN5_9CELL|nr:hypothetical protein [Sediminihabitans luteus]PJJ74141.1 hypothetical protein CLV28_1635 [Sediminihabitans luteus]GII98994.1 hypothetical protein Slu03_13720 [Sediminihabitans luteus]